MILAGPSVPKFIADACVTSENVGEGGLGELLRLLEPKEKLGKERGRLGAMVCGRRRKPDYCSTNAVTVSISANT